jgi:hypothetical protein
MWRLGDREAKRDGAQDQNGGAVACNGWTAGMRESKLKRAAAEEKVEQLSRDGENSG